MFLPTIFLTFLSRLEPRSLTNETLDALYELYVESKLESLAQNSTQDEPTARIGLGALTSAAGLVFNSLDAVTALGIVTALEARAQYDPRFRTSFPGFVRRNSWLL